jgi:hypothetical protein
VEPLEGLREEGHEASEGVIRGLVHCLPQIVPRAVQVAAQHVGGARVALCFEGPRGVEGVHVGGEVREQGEEQLGRVGEGEARGAGGGEGLLGAMMAEEVEAREGGVRVVQGEETVERGQDLGKRKGTRRQRVKEE